MALAQSIPLAVAVGAFVEAVVVWMPGSDFLRERPRVPVYVATLGLAVAAIVLAVTGGMAVTHGVSGWDGWTATFFTYLLATNNRLFGGPYAFTWTAGWIYRAGSLMPLIPVGGLLAIVGGWYTLPTHRRAGLAFIATAACLLVAFVAGEIYVLWTVRGGLPV